MAASSEAFEALDVEDKADCASDQDLDRAGHKGPDGRGVGGEDIHKLLAGLATVADDLDDAVGLLALHADKQRDIALPQKSAGAADLGKLKTVSQQGFGDLIFVAIMHDRNYQLHGGYPSDCDGVME